MATTDTDPRRERARLEQEIVNAERNEGQARNDLRIAEASLEPLNRKLLAARAQWARLGPGADASEIAAIEEDIFAAERSKVACQSQQSAAALGKRNAEIELHRLKVEHRVEFLTDVDALWDEYAQALRACEAPVSNAAVKHQVAAKASAKMKDAAREILVDRDKAVDFWPSAAVYNDKLRIGPFELQLQFEERSRPAAIAEILNPAPNPKVTPNAKNGKALRALEALGPR